MYFVFYQHYAGFIDKNGKVRVYQNGMRMLYKVIYDALLEFRSCDTEKN